MGYVKINKKGDVFHDIFRHNPYEIVVISPDKIHVCKLIDGDWVTVGSLVHLHYSNKKNPTSRRKESCLSLFWLVFL